MRLALLPLVALVACGPADSNETLLPLVPGATWDYRTADAQGAPGARTVRVLRVERGEALLETREDGLVETTWLQDDDVVLALKQARELPAGGEELDEFHPGALHGLRSARHGERVERSWTVTRGGEAPLEVRSSWEVEGHELITIEAGLFDTVRIRRTQSDGDDALLWYAPGIGLMRAEGAQGSMELVHWVVP